MPYNESATIPYMPSLRMMRSWMAARLAGESDAGAWRLTLRGLRPRDLSRREVAGARGQEPVMLSVAIQGGSSMVKRGHPETWLLSDHGRWRMMHLGALEAAYGTTPFFEHFYPDIRSILLAADEHTPFLDLTAKLHYALRQPLQFESMIDYLRQLDTFDRQQLRKIAVEKNSVGYADLAFLDVIFKKGPESIFTLLPSDLE